MCRNCAWHLPPVFFSWHSRMANLFQDMEAMAARGADGLRPDARASLKAALCALQRPGGGFAGLDGRADPYFTLFAWLGLRALGAAYDRDTLCAYMAAHRHDKNRIDAQCAAFLLAVEGRKAQVQWLWLVAAFLRGETREVYAAFLLMLATGEVPRWLSRVAWWRQRRLFEAEAAKRMPTPRLAAALVLAALAGESGTAILPMLESRRCPAGGFASAVAARADLLATAVARFACSSRWRAGPRPALFSSHVACETLPGRTRKDLAFIESCWLEDGLFGASPRAVRGDAEHTFYAFLALGTCRTDHS